MSAPAVEHQSTRLALSEQEPSRRVPFVLAIIAALIAAIGLIGHLVGKLRFASFLLDTVPMAPVTGLVIVGASFLTARVIWAGTLDHARRWRFLSGGVVAAVGLGTMGEYVFRDDWSRVSSVYNVGGLSFVSVFAGVMAPSTAVAFILLGLAVVLRALLRMPRLSRICESAILVITWLVLLGYAYGTNWLQSFGAPVHMAITTATALACLTAATLLGFPREPLGRIIYGSGAPSVTARWLLPVVVLGPALLGALRLQGEVRGYFDTRGGLTVLVAAMSMLLVAVSLFLIFRLQEMFENAEQQLRAVRWASSIVDSTHEAVMSTTPAGDIVSWNAAAEVLYGYDQTEIVGRSIRTLFPIEKYEELDHLLSAMAAGRAIEFQDTVRVKKSGEVVSVTLTASPLMNTENGIVGISMIHVTSPISKFCARRQSDRPGL